MGPRLTDQTKHNLYAEVLLLRQKNYTVNTAISAHDLVIQVVSPTINEEGGGVIFIDSHGMLKPLTTLSREALDDFLNNFPKNIAPLFAAALEKNPPIPENPLVSDSLIQMVKGECSPASKFTP